MINLIQVKKIVDKGMKSGLMKYLKDLIVYAFMGFMTIIVLNPDIIYKNFKAAQDRDHNAKLERRLEADPLIRNLLNETLSSLQCDRVFICEFHNGTNNFAGLPFIYVDMKYEAINDDVLNIDEEYTNFNLTRYEFVPYGIKNGYWEGDIESMEKIDKRFAQHLKIDNSQYSAFILINGINDMIGILGITYEDANKNGISSFEIQRKMTEVSQKVGILLSPVK